MNGLRDMLYGTGATYTTAQTPASTIGGGFGFNVGSEAFRVQLAISGLLLAAFAVLIVLHAKGNRFSVHV
ncbi:MAG: hypothetical protein ACRD2H_13920 [Terriglobales bacterium]